MSPNERFMRHYYGARGYVAPDFVARELKAGVLLSGNHLASALHSLGVKPDELRLSTYEEVQQKHSLLVADIWMAWKAIMDWANTGGGDT